MGKSKKSKIKQKENKNFCKEFDCEYIQYRSPGARITLKDSGTKLFIKAKCNIRCIKVDHGILQDLGHKVNKCDFLCENLDDNQIHLIEMKHVLLDEAFNRLLGTPSGIKTYTEYGEIFEEIDCLDAYIVSPGAQKTTGSNRERKETELCRMLAKYSRKRVGNIYDLLKYVKVVQKNAGQSSIEGRILCSNDNPLEF